MNPIPKWAQSSIDPTTVSLTVQSIGKAVAGFIVFLGVIGWVDPTIAGQAWGELIADVITAIPAGFAVFHAGYVVWGIIRKIAVRIFAKAPVTASAAADNVAIVSSTEDLVQ